MNKYFKEVLEEMCVRVGTSLKEIDLERQDWYYAYQWTVEEQGEFERWLAKYLKENREARLELMRVPSTNKRFLEKFAKQFTLSYGWRFKL